MEIIGCCVLQQVACLLLSPREPASKQCEDDDDRNWNYVASAQSDTFGRCS